MSEDQVPEDQWLFLIDPAWQPADDGERPPVESIVGGWPTTADGGVGRFRANPSFQPLSPDSATDPVDACLRLAVRGEIETEAFLAVLREADFEVAFAEDGSPIVDPAPDDVPCLLVTTAPAHNHRVRAAEWQQVDTAALSDLLRANEVDVLLNPGADTSIRLLAATVHGVLTQGS